MMFSVGLSRLWGEQLIINLIENIEEAGVYTK
jgi:hypothetical protein